MAQTTSGPWRLGEEREFDGGCAPHGYRMVSGPPGVGPVARVYETGTGRPSNEPVPAARLIAAAPELLAALERLLHETDDGTQPCAREVAEAAHAAVAKARGG